jgi:hypothetical protein
VTGKPKASSAQGASFWDERFSGEGYAYGERPCRLLLGWSDLLPDEGEAFVPACGEGRDAVFLARAGLDVLAVDQSAAGLAKGKALAKASGVEVTWQQADLATWAWPKERFDVIASSYFHVPEGARRKIHRALYAALRPGGLLFIEGFSREQIEFQTEFNSGGPTDVGMLFDAEDLFDDFEDAEPVTSEMGTDYLNDGPFHQGPAAVLRMIFRKPDMDDEEG